ncbi:MAG: ribosomal protein S18-alanine N-acetyltransferase, partial [Acidimicrobiales bacterium]|nr:ribosomal protein S18-alanine N-acetyltransferase [Acidimicrobiales bacterium]
LRLATAHDVHAIMAVDRAVYPTPWSEGMTRDQVSGPARAHVVIEADGLVVAHAGLLFMADEGHISTIAVHPNMQRRGLASALLLALLRAAMTAGCRAVTLEVRSGNDAAMALYRRFGLAPAGVRRGYYADTGEDALVLWSPDFVEGYAERVAEMNYPEQVALSQEIERLNP